MPQIGISHHFWRNFAPKIGKNTLKGSRGLGSLFSTLKNRQNPELAEQNAIFADFESIKNQKFLVDSVGFTNFWKNSTSIFAPSETTAQSALEIGKKPTFFHQKVKKYQANQIFYLSHRLTLHTFHFEKLKIQVNF